MLISPQVFCRLLAVASLARKRRVLCCVSLFATLSLAALLMTCLRTISKWMIYIWFGLDGSGIQYSVGFIAPSPPTSLDTNTSSPSSTRSSAPP